MSAFEIAVFRKANGPLSKHIALKDGKPNPDGSACRMAAGTARRVKLNDIETFAKLIGDMRSDEAPTLGRLRADLPDSVKVITKKELNSSTPPNVIARTGEYLHFAEQAAAFMLLDHDGKGMPNEIAEKLKQHGGFWPAVIAVAPNLDRRSAGVTAFDFGRSVPQGHPQAVRGIDQRTRLHRGGRRHRHRTRTARPCTTACGSLDLAIMSSVPSDSCSTAPSSTPRCTGQSVWCSKARRFWCRRWHRMQRCAARKCTTDRSSTPCRRSRR